VNADVAWRKDPPKAGPASALHLPVPEQFKLENGLTVFYNERPGLPVVTAALVLRAEAARIQSIAQAWRE